jgi:hypothetical protein
MNGMQCDEDKRVYTGVKYKLPLKPYHRDDKHQVPCKEAK